MTDSFEMPVPGVPHQRLALLAGDWSGEEVLHPSPWDPAGGTARGRYSFRMGLEGFFLLAEYEQARAQAVNYRGHGVFGWDARGQCHTMHWFDSLGIDPGQPGLGSWEEDGSRFTFVHETTYLGHSRYTYALDGGRLRVRVENSADARTWRTFLEGSYARGS